MVAKYGIKNCLVSLTVYKFLKSHQLQYYNQLSALCDQCSKYGFLNTLSYFKLNWIALQHLTRG